MKSNKNVFRFWKLFVCSEIFCSRQLDSPIRKCLWPEPDLSRPARSGKSRRCATNVVMEGARESFLSPTPTLMAFSWHTNTLGPSSPQPTSSVHGSTIKNGFFIKIGRAKEFFVTCDLICPISQLCAVWYLRRFKLIEHQLKSRHFPGCFRGSVTRKNRQMSINVAQKLFH